MENQNIVTEPVKEIVESIIEKKDRSVYQKEYRIKNKEALHKPVHCDCCNKTVKFSNMARHIKTTSHIKKEDLQQKILEEKKDLILNFLKYSKDLI